MHGADLGDARVERFGAFELDARAGELRKHGIRLKVSGQPLQILAMLLARPGEMVSREELRTRLWAGDTFVDFDHSLNAAVNKLREALGDSADEPKFIETLPRRGYRWIGPSEKPLASPAAVSATKASSADAPAVAAIPADAPLWNSTTRQIAAALLLGGLLLAAWGAQWFEAWRASSPPTTTAAAPRSIAVLPFKNLSNDPEQEFFADGMTEALIAHLAQVGSLRVTSRTSAMYYKDKKAPLPEIAKALNVDTVIEGSVLRQGGRARISVQLVDARADRPIWSNFYDRDLRDLLSLQNELSREIAQQVRVQISPAEQEILARTRPIEPEALQAYLRGRFYQNKRIGWATARAIPEFENAIRLQPDYVLAHAALAETLLFAHPPAETMPRARQVAARAIEINPRMAAPHAAMGSVKLFWEWDWAGAEAEFRTALEIRPDDAEARSRYAHLLVALGRFDEAIAHLQRALEIDPLSAEHNHVLGRFYYFARQNDKAIAQLKKAIELDPYNYWAHFFLSVVYENEKRYDEAAQEWQRAAAIAGGKALEMVAAAGKLYREQGYEALLRRRVEFEKGNVRGPVASSSIALLHARLGEKENALEWLEKSFAAHTRDLIYLGVEPQYDPLRSDPRFAAMLARLKLPPKQ